MAQYCYSMDEESYTGRYDTLEEAQGAAIEILEDTWFQPGLTMTYWTAEVVHPIDAVGEDWLVRTTGQDAFDRVEEFMAENIYAEDEVLSVTKDEKVELGRMIVQFLREHGKVMYYGVANVQEHSHTINT